MTQIQNKNYKINLINWHTSQLPILRWNKLRMLFTLCLLLIKKTLGSRVLHSLINSKLIEIKYRLLKSHPLYILRDKALTQIRWRTSHTTTLAMGKIDILIKSTKRLRKRKGFKLWTQIDFIEISWG
jgi:hypothetical protein